MSAYNILLLCDITHLQPQYHKIFVAPILPFNWYVLFLQPFIHHLIPSFNKNILYIYYC